MGYVFGREPHDCCDLGDETHFDRQGDDDPAATPDPNAPGYLDSLINYFNPPVAAPVFNQGQGPLVAAENPPAQAVVSPDPNEQYSKYYTLAQLTVTSLPHPNLPLDSDSQNNLRKLGTFLDAIRDNVGDYAIASAFRSRENQAALQQGAGGAAAASMAIKNSYHSMGLAADITPKNGMTPTQFAQAIYQNPITAALAGQIVDKSEGGNETSLHVSIQTNKFPNPTPMYVVAGQYYRMTPTQIGDWLSSKMADADPISVDNGELVTEEDFNDEGSSFDFKTIGMIVAALLGAYLLSQSAKKNKPATV